MNESFSVIGGPFTSVCVPVNVTMDGRIENTETFDLLMSSNDSAVDFGITLVEITLRDSDGMHVT